MQRATHELEHCRKRNIDNLRDGSFVAWPLNSADVRLDIMWQQIVDEGKVSTVFHDGIVDDLSHFRALMQSSLSVGIWDLKTGKWAFLMWGQLTTGLWTETHFCSLGRYKKQAAELAFEVFKGAGIKGLFGLIPTSNVLAQKWAESMGCKKAGHVPGFFLIGGKQVGAVIYHHRFKEG